MDRIEKALKKLTSKERDRVKIILSVLNSNNTNNMASLDIKKLKERNDIFRVRKGKIRILYRVDERGSIYILKISRRNEKTYKT